MNKNQTTQQTKSDPKGKAIASLVLGIISVINVAGPIYWLQFIIAGLEPDPAIGKYIGEYIYIYGNEINFALITFLISAIGIILGKIGLKSTKKGLATAGIILSIIGLLGAVFFTFFMLLMAAGFLR